MHRRPGLLSISNLRLSRGRIAVLTSRISEFFAVLKPHNMQQVLMGGPDQVDDCSPQTTSASSGSGGSRVLLT